MKISISLILLLTVTLFAQQKSYRKILNNEAFFKLTKSNKTLLLDKNTSNLKVRQIDSMLISAPAKFDSYANDPDCAVKYTYTVEVDEGFKPVDNKTLGIWVSPGIEYYKKAIHYGFTKILINKTYNADIVRQAGFSLDNIMYQILDQGEKILPNAGAYYIDEPFEMYRNNWDKQKIMNIARKVYPKRLFVGSYRWPNASLLNFFNNNGSEYVELLNSDPKFRINIMCDEYVGNCHGNVNDFWNEFRNVYGKGNNISNWMNNIINSGDGNSHRNCFYNGSESTNFYDLINSANIYNLKELWLYANDTYWNEANLKKFTDAAWQLKWLTRSGKEVKVTWKCLYRSEADPCEQCNFDKGEGFWIPVKYTYTGKEIILEAPAGNKKSRTE